MMEILNGLGLVGWFFITYWCFMDTRETKFRTEEILKKLKEK